MAVAVVNDGRDTVVLPAVPEVFALYHTADDPTSVDGVLGWIVVLPDRRVLVVRVTGPVAGLPAAHRAPGGGTRPLFPDVVAG